MNIAFLGLGAMGARMAARLIDAGHEVTAYNRTPGRADALVARGARRATAPAEAAAGQDVVIAMVTDDEAAETVWAGPRGALGTISPGTLCVESSTVTPAFVRRLGERVHQAQARLIDAPVAGSRPQAEAGALIYTVGGDAADVEEARPVLLHMGQAVHHCGPLGAGATMKLVVNGLFTVQVAALAELCALARGQGVSPDTVQTVLAQMPVLSPAAGGVLGLMVRGQHQPLFPIDLVVKDLGYAQLSAGLDHGALAGARARFMAAQAAGHGGDNLSAVIDAATAPAT